jgi:hypothetical protein
MLKSRHFLQKLLDKPSHPSPGGGATGDGWRAPPQQHADEKGVQRQDVTSAAEQRVDEPSQIALARAREEKQETSFLAILTSDTLQTPSRAQVTVGTNRQGGFPRGVSHWTARMQRLIEWFLAHVEELPAAAFSLGPALHVADPARWYFMLQLDIAAGPTGPRGRHGALEEELMVLLERWALPHENEATREPR